MPVISINGIDVTFPFEPYQVQLDYMSKVIECLQKKTNAVLESPTGTGKTLSLLCSSLAWLQSQNSAQHVMPPLDVPMEAVPMSKAMSMMNSTTGQTTSAWNSKIKIIYASRTHSQLSQAMAELKRTHYSKVRVTVLGSRDQLCVHPQVKKEEKIVTKNLLCRIFVSERNCNFYNNVEATKVDPSLHTITDIEDLVSNGKRLRSCPYYLAKELQKDSDIIFAPYNYLLDPKIRKTQDISLDNAIIILDEGHNVEKVSEEVMSTKLSSTLIAYCIEEVTEVMKVKQERESTETVGNFEENPDDLSVSELCLLKTVLLELEKVVDEFPLVAAPGKSGPPTKALPGSEIFPILAKAEINDESYPPLLEILYKVSHFATVKSESPFARKGQHLSTFQDFITRVFQSKASAGTCFKLFIETDVPKKGKAENAWAPKAGASSTVSSNAKVLNYWCFNPGFGLRALTDMGVRSVILTSGTLSPLDATISELGIPVGVQLENPHIIKPNQVYITVLGKGPASVELRSTYDNRDNKQYISELGQTILNCVRIIPHGVLVFFPSYSVMNKNVEAWQESGIWSNLSKHKSLFIEQSNKMALNSVIEEFYKAVDERGAVLFAVCRGKISEGLDFSDNRARAVIITGIPYPPIFDPRVTLKKEYLNENCRNNKLSLDGQRWYQLEAIRAVNQALGRVLRHSQDYGALILCDSRFAGSTTNNLSAWLQPLIFKAPSFGIFMQKLVAFFRSSRPVSECAVKPRPTIEYSSATRALPKKSATSNESSENNQSFLSGYAGGPSSSSSTKKKEAEKPLSLFECVDLSSQKTFVAPEREEMPKVKLSSSEPELKRAKLTLKSLKSSDLEAVKRMKKSNEDDGKKDIIQNYLLQVRASISEQEFGKFRGTICKYAKSEISFPELMEVLKNLFPLEKKELRPLFRMIHGNDLLVYFEEGRENILVACQFEKRLYKEGISLSSAVYEFKSFSQLLRF